MKFQINQIELVTAILTEVDRQAKERGIKKFGFVPFQLNSVCEHASAIVRETYRDPVVAVPNMGIDAWLRTDDTGRSSKAMAYHICHIPMIYASEDLRAYPRDPEDFGRCHRFLEAVPQARLNLGMMGPVSAIWSRLVDEWDSLTAIYLEELPTGSAPKLYARMKELGC